MFSFRASIKRKIFLKAQQKNVIAVLDTGSGKTLISALLIKWISTQENSQKKVVFLVPKVPLVEQQSKFIARHTALRVAQVHSELSAGVMDRARWSNLFSQSDVLVMTGQIFLNVLTHSHWGMSKVSLLVFDECHHARKNHPYTTIMAIYRACPEADRPKVFGMTACPTWTSTPQTSLADLEKNLNAQIVTVQENLDEFARYSSKPTEVEPCTGVPAAREAPSQRLVAGHSRIPSISKVLSRISHSSYLESF